MKKLNKLLIIVTVATIAVLGLYLLFPCFDLNIPKSLSTIFNSTSLRICHNILVICFLIVSILKIILTFPKATLPGIFALGGTLMAIIAFGYLYSILFFFPLANLPWPLEIIQTIYKIYLFTMAVIFGLAIILQAMHMIRKHMKKRRTNQ